MTIAYYEQKCVVMGSGLVRRGKGHALFNSIILLQKQICFKRLSKRLIDFIECSGFSGATDSDC